MGLRTYIIKRLIYSFILILLVIVINFTIFFAMPGDPYTAFANPQRFTQEQEELIRRFWGYYDPWHIKLLKYINNLLRWEFGLSVRTRGPVGQEMMARLPWTLYLVGSSTVIAVIVGVLLGVVVAHRRGGIFDTSNVTFSLIVSSLPTFWIGLVLVLIFSKTLGWFPHALPYPQEWGSPTIPFPQPITSNVATQGMLSIMINIDPVETLRYIGGYLSHSILPILTLTLFQYGSFLLLTRAVMLEVLTEDYVTTARAKGVDEKAVLFKHALKNASLPIVTQAALYFGGIIGGAIITETVFSWPGMGTWIFDAITNNNYPVLMASFYVLALTMIVAILIADMLYGVLDPRIRYG
ncbi:MAG: ABC transporter permease [Nitrososphaerota archaeon]